MMSQASLTYVLLYTTLKITIYADIYKIFNPDGHLHNGVDTKSERFPE